MQYNAKHKDIKPTTVPYLNTQGGDVSLNTYHMCYSHM